jgi:hypothetical protein
LLSWGLMEVGSSEERISGENVTALSQLV